MLEIEQAHREMDRIQNIIARHEGHIFNLRGWLFAALAGSVAGYFTNNIPFETIYFVLSIIALVCIFILIELRHIVLIDALVSRVGDIEEMIDIGRQGNLENGWYEGPKINSVCREAMNWHLGQTLPPWRVTFKQNLIYYVVLLVFMLLMVLLPNLE